MPRIKTLRTVAYSGTEYRHDTEFDVEDAIAKQMVDNGDAKLLVKKGKKRKVKRTV
jgi:hypothetical protein